MVVAVPNWFATWSMLKDVMNVNASCDSCSTGEEQRKADWNREITEAICQIDIVLQVSEHSESVTSERRTTNGGNKNKNKSSVNKKQWEQHQLQYNNHKNNKTNDIWLDHVFATQAVRFEYIHNIQEKYFVFFVCVCALSIQDQMSINHPGNHKRECLIYTKRSCLIHSDSFNMFEPNNMRGWNQWWRSSSPALWQVVSSCPTSVADPMPTRRAFPRNHPGTLKKKGAPKKNEMDKPSNFLGTHVGIFNY